MGPCCVTGRFGLRGKAGGASHSGLQTTAGKAAQLYSLSFACSGFVRSISAPCLPADRSAREWNARRFQVGYLRQPGPGQMFSELWWLNMAELLLLRGRWGTPSLVARQ